MRPSVFIVAAVSFFISSSITFAVIRWLGKGSPTLAFIVGAAVGTNLAAVMHHRNPKGTNSPGVKASIGAVLVISMLALATVLHIVFAPFRFFLVVTLPISAIGSFVFPFILFDTTWRTLSKVRDGS
jgi:hypothetical protein